MKNIYIFDVDGTLTPSRKMMTDDFVEFFKEWSENNIFYIKRKVYLLVVEINFMI